MVTTITNLGLNVKHIRKLIRRVRLVLFKLLSSKIRRKLILSKYKIDDAKTSGITVKVATTEDEILQALKLHHDSYCKENLCEKSPSGLRLSKYQALLTATIIVAKQGAEVIGTISVISRGSFGLPVEQGWNINSLLKAHKNIVEFSAFAVKNHYVKSAGVVIFPLMKFAWRYSTRFLHADGLVAVVKQAYSFFYTDILLHKPLKSLKADNYNLVSVKPSQAAAFYLNLESAEKVFKSTYQHYDLKNNLHSYFVEYVDETHIYPERKFFKCSDYFLTPKILKKIYLSTYPSNISENDKFLLFSNVSSLKSHHALQTVIESNITTKRAHVRVPYRFKTKLITKGQLSKICECTIQSVSRKGISITSNEIILVDEAINVLVPLNNDINTYIKCKVRHLKESDGLFTYGLQIIRTYEQIWHEFIDYQEHGLQILNEDETSQKAE